MIEVSSGQKRLEGYRSSGALRVAFLIGNPAAFDYMVVVLEYVGSQMTAESPRAGDTPRFLWAKRWRCSW